MGNSYAPIILYIGLISIAAVIGLFIAFELNQLQMALISIGPVGLISVYVVLFMMD